MKLVPLSKRTYVLRGNIAPEVRENAGFVVTDRGVVVIDTTRTLADAMSCYQQIKTVTDKDIAYVINTHGHIDHVFGNQIFDAPIICQMDDAEEMRTKLSGEWSAEGLHNIIQAWIRPEEMEGTRIVLPQILFCHELALDMGDTAINVIRVGGHTPGCSIVYLPEERVVFLSDLLCVGRYPVLKLGDVFCDLDEWIESLSFVKKLSAKTIVPGHGPVSAKQELRGMEAYLKELRTRVSRLARQGMTREQIIADPGFMKYAERTYGRLHSANIGYAYDIVMSRGKAILS
ncbi:MAG: MBL fold metallo-hydrolase [Chloroflexi bacterium]|nr:MBL fold metallo-hydrolase [Chloroflexota bacterium]